VTTDDGPFHKVDEEDHCSAAEPQDLSVHIETSSDKNPESPKRPQIGTKVSLPLSTNKTNQEQAQVDPQELLSMVVVTDPTNDVIYIQLPPDSEGETMRRYCESVLFPTEGDTFLSVENFNKRRSLGDETGTSSNSIGGDTTVMLPLGVEEVEEAEGTDEVKDGEQVVLMKGIPTEQRPQRNNEFDAEMTVIEAPSDADEYMGLPQHDMGEGQGQGHGEPDSYDRVSRQSLEGPVPVPEGTTTEQKQERYLVIFK
jgi:hypothetical protein